MKAFEVGDIVEHPTFGTGELVKELPMEGWLVQMDNGWLIPLLPERLKHFNINELIQ